MRFHLHYEGRIKGNGRRSEDKDRIRAAIAPQLAQLWRDNESLGDLLKYDCAERPRYTPREVNARFFRPMIVEALHLRCELDILMLVPQRSFAVFHSGDLDNRIKTLIDGLRLPTGQNEVSDILVSNTAKDPYNVLLEDDRLITSVSAKSDVLLGATQQEIEDGVCRAIIKVHFFPISPTMDTFALIG